MEMARGSGNQIVFPLAVQIFKILGPASPKIPKKSTFLSKGGGISGKSMNAREKNTEVPEISIKFTS